MSRPRDLHGHRLRSHLAARKWRRSCHVLARLEERYGWEPPAGWLSARAADVVAGRPAARPLGAESGRERLIYAFAATPGWVFLLWDVAERSWVTALPPQAMLVRWGAYLGPAPNVP